jgi:NAD+ diphosphatase
MQRPMPLTQYANTFSGNPLDRAGDKRSDPAWVESQAAMPDASAIAFWRGQPLVETAPDGTPRLAYLRADMALDAVSGMIERRLFLGLWKDAPVFAVEFTGTADPAVGPLQGLGTFEELRGLAPLLAPAEAGIAATAKSLFDWQGRHRYCANCGQESALSDGGWKRICPACKTEHFPRTDPVTIMLPVKGERCLLGRQAAWPAGRMSALAGFLEPGETIEEACARELSEEAGLRTERVVYHSSQPWPWPSNLMIGLIAHVENEDATPDQTELEEVRWFTRSEIRRMLESPDGFDSVQPPPPFAIARTLMQAWVDGFGG